MKIYIMLHSSMVLCRIYSYYTHMPETLECGIKLINASSYP